METTRKAWPVGRQPVGHSVGRRANSLGRQFVSRPPASAPHEPTLSLRDGRRQASRQRRVDGRTHCRPANTHGGRARVASTSRSAMAAAAEARTQRKAHAYGWKPMAVRPGRQSSSGACLSGCALRQTIAIWLILPVVICLSQRLSHACLSTRLNTARLRMAH